MKIKILVAVIILSSLNILSAQGLGLGYGIKGGYNLSEVTLNKEYSERFDKSTSIGSYHVGAYINFELLIFKEHGKIVVQAELIYNQIGREYEYNNGLGDGILSNVVSLLNADKKTTKLSYLSVPIGLQYFVIPALLYVEGGPQFNYLIFASDDSYDINDSRDVDFSAFAEKMYTSFDEGFKKVDFSAFGGIGIKIPLIRVGANVRYVYGLTNLSSLDSFDVKQSNIMLSVNYNW